YTTGQYLHFTWIPDVIFLGIISVYLYRKSASKALLALGLLIGIKAIGSISIMEHYPDNFVMLKDIVKTSLGYGFILMLFSYIKEISSQKTTFRPKLLTRIFCAFNMLIALSIFVGLL